MRDEVLEGGGGGGDNLMEAFTLNVSVKAGGGRLLEGAIN